MGSFPYYNDHKHIMVAVGYVSKWVDDVALHINDANVLMIFVGKNIFTRFGTSQVLISDWVPTFVTRCWIIS